MGHILLLQIWPPLLKTLLNLQLAIAPIKIAWISKQSMLRNLEDFAQTMSSVIYMPSPRLYPGVARRVPNDYQKLIVLPDENGDLRPVPIEMEEICTADAEMTDIRHLKIPIDRQFLPEVPETRHVPRLRLCQVR